MRKEGSPGPKRSPQRKDLESKAYHSCRVFRDSKMLVDKQPCDAPRFEAKSPVKVAAAKDAKVAPQGKQVEYKIAWEVHSLSASDRLIMPMSNKSPLFIPRENLKVFIDYGLDIARGFTVYSTGSLQEPTYLCEFVARRKLGEILKDIVEQKGQNFEKLKIKDCKELALAKETAKAKAEATQLEKSTLDKVLTYMDQLHREEKARAKEADSKKTKFSVKVFRDDNDDCLLTPPHPQKNHYQRLVLIWH